MSSAPLVGDVSPQGECDSYVLCEGKGQFIGYVIVLPIICTVGAVLNIINLAVFKQRGLKFHPSTLVFLRWMAVMDFLTLVIVFNIGFCRCIDNTSTAGRFAQDIYEIYIFLPFSNMTAGTSVWTTVILTAERYIFVAHPILAKRISTRYHAKMICVVVLVSALFLHIPYFFMQSPTLRNGIQYTAFGESTGYVVYSWIRLVLAKMLPILLVGVVNSLLVYSAWRRHRTSQKVITTNKATQRRERLQFRITILTLCISTTFFFCHFLEPFANYGIQSSIFGPCSMATMRYTTFLMMINILEMISFAINFLFYCVFNRRFCEELDKLLGCTHTKVDVAVEVSDHDHSTSRDDNNTTSSSRRVQSTPRGVVTVATIA